MAEPIDSVFYNKVMDRTAMKQLISRLVAHFGIAHATHVLDQLKALGFQQATSAAISLGIDDLSTAPSKGWLIEDAERYGNLSEKHHDCGDLHAVEKLRQLIETWYAMSEYLKQEMNPNFRMTDPSNPVHMMSFSGARGSASQVHQLVGMRGLVSDPQGQIIDLPIRNNFREGLSLTEYIISCYGARKGVVDTAVRTSDAGYPTRRLVEVVQHIVVRRMDCGTFRGILIGDSRRGRGSLYQELIGRILSENIYISNRCFATRNQDIGASLANESVNLKGKPIPIRSPLTCKSMLWIRQLCYGWSPTNGNLIEMGEAVGIIAGQSIGEPGTQLTLRTFHTGGVFTGDIAEHIRTPFNGIMEFDENSICPTRTRHGHPAWICRTELRLKIRGRSETYGLTIPKRSLLLVQNGQCVESKQVIAEIRAETSPSKEKVQKYVHSNLEGEMHWGAKVRHASGYARSDVHPILEASHIWILSGSSCDRINKFRISSCENQDKIDSRIFIAKDEPLHLGNKNQLNISILNLYISKRNKIISRFGLTHTVRNDLNNSVELNTVLYGYSVGKNHNNFLLTKKYTIFPFILQVRRDGTIRNDDAFAALDHPKYRSKKSGIVKYGTVETESTGRNNYLDGARSPRPRYRIVRGGNFFLIPEEVHILNRTLSPLLVRNNKFIQAGVPIASNFVTGTSGLVRIRRGISNSYEVKVLPGTIYYPNRTYKISKQINILVPPSKKLFNRFRCDHWTYIQWIIPPKEKPFVLIRSVTEYEIFDEFHRTSLLKLLGRNTNLEIKAVNFLLCRDGERVQILKRDIQLIQTCLIVHWGGKYFSKRANISFLRVGTNKSFRNFFQVTSINRSHSNYTQIYRDAPLDPQYILRKSYYQKLLSIRNNRLGKEDRGVIRISYDRNSKMQSFIVLSSSDSVRVFEINESEDSVEKISTNSFLSTRFFDFCTHSRSCDYPKKLGRIRNDSLLKGRKSVESTVSENLGLIGNLHHVMDLPEFFHWTLDTVAVSSNPSIIGLKWYFVGEYKRIYEFIPEGYINLNSLKWFTYPFLLKEILRPQILNLGQFIFNDLRISEYGGVLPSGQIIGIHTNRLVVRLAEPYLTTKGATIHNDYGESIKEGDTPTTLMYERLRSGDTIQGLPRVEQLLEARSVNSIPANLENGFEDWNNDMKRFIGNLWGFFLSARIGMEQGQIVLVDQIRKVYQSQGVHISDKHIEIIVRQMTSKVVTSEDGTIDIFLPGELIEFSQAQGMERVLEEAFPYEPILLGVTKASLNSQSFISEASFQETTRILAKAALKGRTDWLKGLKENVVLGEVVPAGTGSREVIWQMDLERGREITIVNDSFGNEVRNIFVYEDAFPISPAVRTVHNVLKESIARTNRNVLFV
uniref:RNA polymerase beta'' subunit n=1 Tax=Fossombronia foveolata TaxID=56918 RepID=UPI00257C39A0|nr:RNA polymerase beta'' subunit [Fossombronia foveolata]WIA67195.1 RNA polymerase beta'' subunit [Fossombronia foveolata]